MTTRLPLLTSTIVLLALTGCRGADAPEVTDVAAGDECANGGVQITADDQTYTICNGVDGVDGVDGESGGDGDDGADGTPVPVIQAIWVTGLPLAPGGEAQVHVSTSGSGTDSLTYTWETSTDWTISAGQGTDVVTITAPDAPFANGTVTLTLDDTSGQSATGIATLATAGSDLPQIAAMAITPQPVVDTAQLVVAAQDPSGTSLDVSWTIGGVEVATGAAATWTNPGVPGWYDATVTVTDDDGNTASHTMSIEVGSDSAWPAQGRTLQSTEAAAPGTPAAAGTLKWSYPGPGLQNNPVLDADGNVYVGSWYGDMVAIDTAGVEIWTQVMDVGVTDNADIYPAPLVANDKVYWVSWNGDLNEGALADGTGWTYESGEYNDNSSPIVGADGTLYFGSMDPTAVYAVNPDGSLKWEFETFENVQNDIALAPDGTVLVVAEDILHAINPDGTERWWWGLDGSMQYSNLAVGRDGTIYVPDVDNGVVALTIDGTVLWWSDYIDTPRGASLAADGTIYVIDSDCTLFALNGNGSTRWTHEVSDCGCWTTPAIGGDGTVYYADGDGRAWAVASDGSLVWEKDDLVTEGTESAFTIGADGTLFIGTYEEGVNAIE